MIVAGLNIYFLKTFSGGTAVLYSIFRVSEMSSVQYHIVAYHLEVLLNSTWDVQLLLRKSKYWLRLFQHVDSTGKTIITMPKVNSEHKPKFNSFDMCTARRKMLQLIHQ